MFKSILLSSVLIVAAAGAAMAAPNNIGDQRTIDRWVEIFRPWELVGPPVDPQLKQAYKQLVQPVLDPSKGGDPHPEEIDVQVEIAH